MMEWWNSLHGINQWFYVAAAFFSVFFLWQLIAAMAGLGGNHDMAATDHEVGLGGDHAGFDHAGMDHGEVAHPEPGEPAATLAAFRLLSVRSVLAFFTLFCWAGALYLNRAVPLTWALAYAVAWGLAAMLIVAGVFHLLRRLTETGNPRIATCVGTEGTVHLDIPPEGQGEVRVTLSGVISMVKARCVGGAPLKAGAPIRVVRVLDGTTVEVEPLGGQKGKVLP